MTKYLVPIQLPADPTQPLEAATKQYVDNLINTAASEVVISASDPIATFPNAELWYQP